MSNLKSLEKSIAIKCYDVLESAGFRRFGKYGVDWPLNEDFNCWVGLNFSHQTDHIDLVPNIGLQVEPIERLITKLDASEFSWKYSRSIATYSINLGTIKSVEKERAFAFSLEQGAAFIENECERLARLYAEEGLPYVTSIASYEALAMLLKDSVESLGGVPQRYAACLYLGGKPKIAQKFLLNFPEIYKTFLKGFSEPFNKLIEKELND